MMLSPVSKPPISSPGFLRASFLLLLANNSAAALHYVFQCMMGRSLSTEDFGLMNTLFSLVGFLSLPVSAYTLTLTRQWAELANASRHEEAERLWYALVVVAGVFCLTGMLIAWWLTPWLAWWLKTQNETVICVAILGTGLGTVLSLANPFLVARQWFMPLAIGGIVGAGLRIGVAWMGIRWQVPLSGAVAATTLYGGVLAFFAFRRVRWPGWSQLSFQKLLPAKCELFASLLVAFSSFCLLGADLLVVRRLYDPYQAGLFAQVMILGRIIFFLIGPIGAVIFPKTATSLLNNTQPREEHVVRRGLIFGAVILLAAALAISLLAPIGFQLLRGSSDAIVVGYLRIAVWCLIPLSLSQLILPSLFARRQERLLLEFTLICTLLPAGLAIFRDNLIHAFLVEGAVGIFLLSFAAFRLSRTSR